ncbi:uncharacterized protein EDB91DRAFT_534627 [Suillus paluster]|uniref:uncharacterized protein n=1 Tax=Suillus paluster TaxID=48578 RepID=UPI001B873E54|nr:uncharacterized protein EDB91DRAFT_534627 [Suillus paluster]KAG1736072.1 hypothetical protein EDB91DRAFT_534627 [Suillus paluster]
MLQCYLDSLHTEMVCSILKAALEVIVEEDMMITPQARHRVLAGGLPFPHTMALVCRRWRDIVSSTSELWTRIFYVSPQVEVQWMRSQLERTGNHPLNLTIINQRGPYFGISSILSCIAPHVQRLRSLRILDFYGAFDRRQFDMLTGHAPRLECLRLTDSSCLKYFLIPLSQFKLDCPALRILDINEDVVDNFDHQWLKNSLTHIEFMTISFDGSGHHPISGSQAVALSRALNAVPRRIPCLTLNNLQLPSIISMKEVGIKFGAEKVILRACIDALDVIDDNCQTIALHRCNSIHELYHRLLPSSNSLELDWCAGKGMWRFFNTRTWDGGTVTITNSHSSCIKVILHLLGAPFKHQSCSLWPRVTTLKLVAKGNFVMDVPLTILKAMINSRRGATGQENLAKTD